MRLQKYLASCGVSSRRKAEEMIKEGLVTVNGVLVTEMGVQVEEKDVIFVNGKKVEPETEKRYVIYHKRAGEVTTVTDPEGRNTVLDHFRDFPVRLFPVGRLDYDSEGLLLLTNDGELADRMMHPKNEVDKTYYARVDGAVTPDQILKLRQGVVLPDGRKTSRAKVRIAREEAFATCVIVAIHEGRNRQVRRMFEAVGHTVFQLRRIRFGPLDLGDLKRGEYRELTLAEVEALKNSL